MSDLYFVSRNFTEFGAFSAPELMDFYKRHILTENDFVRRESASEWLPLHSWLSGENKSANPIKAVSDDDIPSSTNGKALNKAARKKTGKVAVA